MKAIVMAGGKGSRLKDAKGHMNKHALPVYNMPMIEHVVRTIVGGGITDILVMLNSRYPETIMEILEDGNRLGCNVSYTYVQGIVGPGRELAIAKHYTRDDPFIVMLGDSLYLEPLSFLDKTAPHIWTMPLNSLDDASKYGQVKVSGDRVLEVREKPSIKFSDIIQTATWLFPPSVYEKAEQLSAQKKDEVHIGDISELYVKEGAMTCTMLPPNSYIDLGTPESLLKGATLLQQAKCNLHGRG